MTLAEQLIARKMAVSLGEVRRMLAQGAIRIKGREEPLHIENLHDEVQLGDTILIGCKKSFTVTEGDE